MQNTMNFQYTYIFWSPVSMAANNSIILGKRRLFTYNSFGRYLYAETDLIFVISA